MTLTKAHIIENVQSKNGFTKKRAIEVVETFLELMKQSLEKDGEVLISGFGKFTVREKGERKGRNPATIDDLTLKPRKVVTFKCSGQLREKINEKQFDPE